MCPFYGCKLTTPMSLENVPSRRYITTLFKPMEQRIRQVFTFDGALFFKLYFLAKSLKLIIYFL